MTYQGVNIQGNGFRIPELDVKCVLRGGSGTVNRGTLVALCLNDQDDISADTDPTTGSAYTVVPYPNGRYDSMFSSVTAAYSVYSVRHGIFGVTLEDATDQGEVWVRLRGKVDAYVSSDNNGTYTIGIGLCASHTTITGGTTGYLNYRTTGGVGPTAGDDRKMIGICFDTAFSASPTSTGELTTVLFDGINGFGSSAV